MNVNKVDIYNVLAAREERVIQQKKMIEKWNSPVICFMLNIPGEIKVSDEYHWAFCEGRKRILHQLQENYITINEEKLNCPVTGYEAYISVRSDAIALKQIMTQIEEEDRMGRVFDIDVINLNGNKISREDIHREPRKCILCEREAHICARSRTHLVEEMVEYIGEVIRECKAQKKKAS